MSLRETLTDASTSVEIMALDWASLGRRIRRRTLEAAAMHFVALAESNQRAISGADSLETTLEKRIAE